MGKFVIQPHGRLQEWVAEELGYFTDEGLDYEFASEWFAGDTRTTSAVQSTDDASHELKSGALEDMEQGRACDVSGACHWAVNEAATKASGKMWGNAYSVSPAGIYVAADSAYNHPQDLAGVPVAVGYHSGSHYSAIQALSSVMDQSEITTTFAGFPYDRVRLMMRGEVQAANVFGPQAYLLEQLGFRKLLDTTFMMGFYISENADHEDTERYFRALEKAQRDIDLEQERYKKYWLREMPEDLAAIADIHRFGPGERIVFQQYTQEMYDTTQAWMKKWDLLDLEIGVGSGFEKAVLA
jgi:NitT/TauT family transport system substrate-binding protein